MPPISSSQQALPAPEHRSSSSSLRGIQWPPGASSCRDRAMETQNHLGWKRPLRSPGPTISMEYPTISIHIQPCVHPILSPCCKYWTENLQTFPDQTTPTRSLQDQPVRICPSQRFPDLFSPGCRFKPGAGIKHTGDSQDSIGKKPFYLTIYQVPSRLHGVQLPQSCYRCR